MTPGAILAQDPYLNYLASKQKAHKLAGFEVEISDLHPMLFDWQKLVVQWALSLGKAALFEERGLGKTLQQAEWAKQVYNRIKKPVLIVCPLAVAKQTIREAAKIDVPLTYVRSMAEAKMSDTPFLIINYDMLEELDPRYFGGLVLDESSILKSYTGKTKQFILNRFTPSIAYRLFCTATPSPNDVMELGNHSEGLGAMDSSQMLANWFQSSAGNVKSGEIVAGKYALRPYAEKDFWRWVTTWAAIVSKPSDLGFSNEGYNRQPLQINYHLLEVDHSRAWVTMDDKGQYNMFLGNKLSATQMWGEKAVTFEDRCKKGVELVEAEPGEYHIVWCDTNDESEMMNRELSALYPGDVVEVKGSDPLKEKEAKLDAFSTGQARIIVTKSKIAGMGLNWQHCARHKFVSVNFKWEEWYQAVGRTDRFGNERQTIADMVYTETEDRILKTLERKNNQHQEMHQKVKKIIAEFGLWRTDKKTLNSDLGKEKMRLPPVDVLSWTYGNGEWGKPEKVYRAYLCNQHAALFLQPMYSYVRKGAATEKPCQLCQLSEHLEKETMNRQRLNGLFQAVIRQAFGQNWAAYHADCVIGMRGLPDNSIHFTTESPPFLALYIYSDSIADLGNTESEEEFFTGYRFSIAEQYRVTDLGRYVAIHCKDTMRYMSSHGYAGLYDFPGQIIQNFQAEGFLFTRWVTVWKDPVVEMQRTKTYGLLHKSFKERAEVTRQGCADFVLIFQKPYTEGRIDIVSESMPTLPPAVFERIRHQWSQDAEIVGIDCFAPHLSVWSKPLSYYSDEFIEELSRETQPGRLAVIHCRHLEAINGADLLACKFDMPGEIIRRFKNQGSWKFHSRCALTDGTYLIVFRNWTPEFKKNYKELNGVVSHNLKAPTIQRYRYLANNAKLNWFDANRVTHPDYVGNQPPTNWHDDGYYSILVWQKYASPVWFDLDGLPADHSDCWMDIDQTDVLNARLVKEEEGEKHICPLQLGLIGRLIEEYTEPGEIVLEPYLGIGSVIVKAIEMGRRGIGFELKSTYFDIATRYLQEAELASTQVDMWSVAGISVQ